MPSDDACSVYGGTMQCRIASCVTLYFTTPGRHSSVDVCFKHHPLSVGLQLSEYCFFSVRNPIYKAMFADSVCPVNVCSHPPRFTSPGKHLSTSIVLKSSKCIYRVVFERLLFLELTTTRICIIIQVSMRTVRSEDCYQIWRLCIFLNWSNKYETRVSVKNFEILVYALHLVSASTYSYVSMFWENSPSLHEKVCILHGSLVALTDGDILVESRKNRSSLCSEMEQWDMK